MDQTFYTTIHTLGPPEEGWVRIKMETYGTEGKTKVIKDLQINPGGKYWEFVWQELKTCVERTLKPPPVD